MREVMDTRATFSHLGIIPKITTLNCKPGYHVLAATNGIANQMETFVCRTEISVKFSKGNFV